MTPREEAVREQLAKLKKKERKLQKKLTKIQMEELIQCQNCGSEFAVKVLTYIQTHWYVEPYSCTGGDYWEPGEGQWDCPCCDARNRLYNQPEVMALKPYFKEVVKVYDRLY